MNVSNCKNNKELNKDPEQISTPVGWTLYKWSNAEVLFPLSQLLKAIKRRERTVSIDGIYSILGLLPYKVRPEYKPRICPDCPENKKTKIREETKDCQHGLLNHAEKNKR